MVVNAVVPAAIEMHFINVIRITGIFLCIHSFGFLPPLLISFYYDEQQHWDFAIPYLLAIGVGFFMVLSTIKSKGELHRHEGFLIVASFWMILTAFSALPFVLGPHLDFSDSIFEAASAFTTTGATVITNLESLPRSILFYRHELQWLGGMGIVVLGVAIRPVLGMGGMQLFRAEIPGPMKDEKLTPRIVHAARIFCFMYIVFSIVCALAYKAAGMSWFDAIAHSMSTLSTGGFSTHDESMGYFKNLPIELITIFFMYLGALNFNVYFMVIAKRTLRHYFGNPEVMVFTWLVLIVTSVVTLVLYLKGAYSSLWLALRHAAFTSVSVITSTGYTTENFSLWPIFLPVMLIFISFVGGCSGSTAGGMKVIRFMLLFKQGYLELVQLVHPRMVRPLTIAGRVYQQSIINGVWGFFALYIAVFVFLMLIMMMDGSDQVTAFSAVATCLNNLGPGLGGVTSNFQTIGDPQKILLAFSMLLGRLEIYTLLVLFTPVFWKR